MFELLTKSPQADTQPSTSITAPFNLWKNGGSIDRHRLYTALRTCAAYRGIQPDVSYGVNSFVSQRFMDPSFNLAPIVTFMVSLAELTEGKNFYKSRSLNYLTDRCNVGTALDQTLGNAGYMVNLFGIDFFSRDPRFPERRKTFFKALIPDSAFYLTAKGGSGAGTFSIDLALGIEKGQGFRKNSGEIWRTGLDTEILPNGELGIRFIRTGSGVRHDPLKTAQFEEFKHTFKTSPARALTFLAVNYAQRLSPIRITALTTHGAKILSTLPKDPRAYDYSRLFLGMGFTEQDDNQYWFQLADLTHPRRRERVGFRRLTEAFSELKDANGQSILQKS